VFSEAAYCVTHKLKETSYAMVSVRHTLSSGDVISEKHVNMMLISLRVFLFSNTIQYNTTIFYFVKVTFVTTDNNQVNKYMCGYQIENYYMFLSMIHNQAKNSTCNTTRNIFLT
jgi:hypothetical protein